MVECSWLASGGDDGNFYFLHLENNQLLMDGLYEAQRLKTNA